MSGPGGLHPSGAAGKPGIAVNSIIVTALNAVGQAANLLLFAGIAMLFGAGRETDTFFLALAVPFLLINPLTNSISSVLIPVLAERRVRRPDQLGQLVGSALTYGLTLSTGVSVLLALITPLGFRLFAGGFEAPALRVATEQALILLPMVIVQTASAVLAAFYNSTGRFWQPPVAVGIRYLATLALLVGLRPLLGGHALPVSFLVGSLIQLVVLISTRPRGIVRPSLVWRADPDVVRSLRISLPLILGNVVLQSGVLVTRFMAARLAPGSVSVLDYASRISSTIVELLTSGFLLVTLANWSDFAARKEVGELRTKLEQTVLMAMFLFLPLIGLLLLLGEPLLGLVLQRGQFARDSTTRAAAVLTFLLLGVPIDIVGRIYVRILLVWQQTWAVAQLAVLRFVTTVLIALSLIGVMQVRGLALADTIALLSVLIGLIIRCHALLGNTLTGMGRPLVQMAVGTAIGVVTASFSYGATEGVADVLRIGGAAAVGYGVYLASAAALRSQELRTIWNLVQPRKAGQAVT